MPTLVLNDVPPRLYDRIQRLAADRKRSPADTVVEVLETALSDNTVFLETAPVQNAIFLTEEICAPFTIPRPEGTLVRAVRVDTPIPTAHDFPEGD